MTLLLAGDTSRIRSMSVVQPHSTFMRMCIKGIAFRAHSMEPWFYVVSTTVIWRDESTDNLGSRRGNERERGRKKGENGCVYQGWRERWMDGGREGGRDIGGEGDRE